MRGDSPENVTQFLLAWSKGDEAALEHLSSLIYDELRRIAHLRLRQERPGHTLQTTALVNEAYLRLVDQQQVNWQNRAHFFAVASQMMRRILVDYARSRQTARREGEEHKVSIDESMTIAVARSNELILIDDALQSLARFDERKCRIVELRFFGGLTIEETAEVLKISHATVEREWQSARAWLYREISSG